MFGLAKTDHVAEVVTGPIGQRVRESVGELATHFNSLDGWKSVRLSVPELIYLAAFNAWTLLRLNHARLRLTRREGIEVGPGLVQVLCSAYGSGAGLTDQQVVGLKERGFDRLKEYDVMWEGGIKKGDLGAFFLHAFGCVQADDEKTQDGFFDHLTTFRSKLVQIEDKLKGVL